MEEDGRGRRKMEKDGGGWTKKAHEMWMVRSKRST